MYIERCAYVIYKYYTISYKGMMVIHRFWYLWGEGPGTNTSWILRDNCVAFASLKGT
jgi:hypothetical protein